MTTDLDAGVYQFLNLALLLIFVRAAIGVIWKINLQKSVMADLGKGFNVRMSIHGEKFFWGAGRRCSLVFYGTVLREKIN